MLAMAVEHVPVLVEEAVDLLNVRPGGVYLDCTVGMGGHAQAILERLRGQGRLIALDRDCESLEMARERLAEYRYLASFHHENFKNLPLILRRLQIDAVDGCLVDLGVSRYQLTSPERGFSLREHGLLDMRMDRQQRITAEELVNRLSVEELTEVFRRWGEERQAAAIARAIVENRKLGRIRTTDELAALVARVKGFGAGSRIHPATQVFQALRIAVNQELEGLDRFLSNAIGFLRPAGRLGVISFHSLEDRIVKRTFQLESGRCICFRPLALCRCPRVARVRLVTRKPVIPGPAEMDRNPSARSAKLRVVERLEAAREV
jgi:16S rRNA (cytosine1402-N4)-methyltransferase